MKSFLSKDIEGMDSSINPNLILPQYILTSPHDPFQEDTSSYLQQSTGFDRYSHDEWGEGTLAPNGVKYDQSFYTGGTNTTDDASLQNFDITLSTSLQTQPSISNPLLAQAESNVDNYKKKKEKDDKYRLKQKNGLARLIELLPPKKKRTKEMVLNDACNLIVGVRKKADEALMDVALLKDHNIRLEKTIAELKKKKCILCGCVRE